MKILLLNDEPWDSGITAYFIQVANLLKEAGDEVVVGVRPGKIPQNKAERRGIRTAPISGIWDVARLLKSNDWDIVNPHTGRTHTWTILAKKLLGHQRFGLVRSRGDAREVSVHPLSRFVYRQTHAVIAASDHIRKQYEIGFGFNEEEARTIYPSVRLDETVAPLPKNKVGILGRLDVVKGHAFFIEAAAHVLKKMDRVRFLIAGKEAGINPALLRNQARELGIESQIELLGFTDSSVDFMKGCTLGVISSIGSEEVSRGCLEWMSVGRPVVGTLVGCLPELIEPQETGLLVPSEDSEELGEAILKLLQNPELADQWGKAGHRLAERRFSAEAQLEKTRRLFQWAMERARN